MLKTNFSARPECAKNHKRTDSMTLESAYALAMTWLKRACNVGLLIFTALTVLKLFGVNAYPIASAGYQELGVFLAGTAFALSKL